VLKSFQDRIDSLEGQERYYFGFNFSSEQAGDLSSLLNNVWLHYEVISSRNNLQKEKQSWINLSFFLSLFLSFKMVSV
jgi:hypothetical protein